MVAGTTESYVGTTSGGVLTIKDAQNDTAKITLEGNYTNSTFTLSSDGHGGTIAIDPPKDGFNFASNPPQANAADNAVGDGRRCTNDGFVFHQPGRWNFRKAGHLHAFNEFESTAENSRLMALANDAQSDHHWTDAGHVTDFGHPEFTTSYLAQTDHFLVH